MNISLRFAVFLCTAGFALAQAPAPSSSTSATPASPAAWATVELVSPIVVGTPSAESHPILRSDSTVVVRIAQTSKNTSAGPARLQLYLAGREVAATTVPQGGALVREHTFPLKTLGGNLAFAQLLRDYTAQGNPPPVDLQLGINDGPDRTAPIPVRLGGDLEIEHVRPTGAPENWRPRIRGADVVNIRVTVATSDPVITPLKLFLDGREVAQIPASREAPLALKGVHSFEIKTAGGNLGFIQLLRERRGLGNKPVRLHLGVADTAIRSNTLPADIAGLTGLGLTFTLATFLAILGIIVWKWKSTLLRDTCGLDPAKRTFSLSRVQMAWWTLWVLPAFVYIFATTGRLDSLNNSVLALIGISSTTLLAAVAIGNARRDQAAQTLATLLPQQAAAQTERLKADAVLAANPEDAPAKAAVAKANLLDAQVNSTQAALACETAGFWKDIMSDADGISLHRLQLVMWTAVLGVIFLYNLFTNYTMEQFDATLLGLMGISSGTYLGFKLPQG